jgi:hypothetical protein
VPETPFLKLTLEPAYSGPLYDRFAVGGFALTIKTNSWQESYIAPLSALSTTAIPEAQTLTWAMACLFAANAGLDSIFL